MINKTLYTLFFIALTATTGIYAAEEAPVQEEQTHLALANEENDCEECHKLLAVEQEEEKEANNQLLCVCSGDSCDDDREAHTLA